MITQPNPIRRHRRKLLRILVNLERAAKTSERLQYHSQDPDAVHDSDQFEMLEDLNDKLARQAMRALDLAIYYQVELRSIIRQLQ